MVQIRPALIDKLFIKKRRFIRICQLHKTVIDERMIDEVFSRLDYKCALIIDIASVSLLTLFSLYKNLKRIIEKCENRQIYYSFMFTKFSFLQKFLITKFRPYFLVYDDKEMMSMPIESLLSEEKNDYHVLNRSELSFVADSIQMTVDMAKNIYHYYNNEEKKIFSEDFGKDVNLIISSSSQ